MPKAASYALLARSDFLNRLSKAEANDEATARLSQRSHRGRSSSRRRNSPSAPPAGMSRAEFWESYARKNPGWGIPAAWAVRKVDRPRSRERASPKSTPRSTPRSTYFKCRSHSAPPASIHREAARERSNFLKARAASKSPRRRSNSTPRAGQSPYTVGTGKYLPVRVHSGVNVLGSAGVDPWWTPVRKTTPRFTVDPTYKHYHDPGTKRGWTKSLRRTLSAPLSRRELLEGDSITHCGVTEASHDAEFESRRTHRSEAQSMVELPALANADFATASSPFRARRNSFMSSLDAATHQEEYGDADEGPSDGVGGRPKSAPAPEFTRSGIEFGSEGTHSTFLRRHRRKAPLTHSTQQHQLTQMWEKFSVAQGAQLAASASPAVATGNAGLLPPPPTRSPSAELGVAAAERGSALRRCASMPTPRSAAASERAASRVRTRRHRKFLMHVSGAATDRPAWSDKW